MASAFTLTATSRTGVQQAWDATVDHNSTAGTWSYHVKAAGCVDFFEARFVQFGAEVQPDVLSANHPDFKGKGLTEAIFDHVAHATGLTLMSSTNKGTKRVFNESRTIDAERLWRGLFATERASYDTPTDRYTFLPGGIAQASAFSRVAASPRRPKFYVKGSYVLDVIFGTSYARDIDICWLDAGCQPTANRVKEWMGLCGFGSKPVQLVRVTDFFAGDGGGTPIFNIDLLRIEPDGCVYQMDPATHVATRVARPLSTPLAFLPNLPPLALMPSPETNTMLDKALRKMQQHPFLNDTSVVAQIFQLKSRPIS